MNEQYFETLLNIKTSGKQDLDETSIHYNRYEPTEYSSLDKFFKEYKLNSNDSIVDFGCGKGRLNFYINHFFDLTVTGIEMNHYFYKEALNNKTNYLAKHKKNPDNINFYCSLAEDYKIKPNDNIFYFFNPFSIQIFMKVLENILISVEESKRIVDLILYYPSDDYIFFLENYTLIKLFNIHSTFLPSSTYKSSMKYDSSFLEKYTVIKSLSSLDMDFIFMLLISEYL